MNLHMNLTGKGGSRCYWALNYRWESWEFCSPSNKSEGAIKHPITIPILWYLNMHSQFFLIMPLISCSLVPSECNSRMSYTCFVQCGNGSTKCTTAESQGPLWCGGQHWVSTVCIFYTEIYSYVKAQPFWQTFDSKASHIHKRWAEVSGEICAGQPRWIRSFGMFTQLCVSSCKHQAEL